MFYLFFKLIPMLKLILLALLLAAGFVTVCQNKNDEALIKALDQKNARLVVSGDTLGLMKLLAPEFTINRTTGTISSGREKTLQLMRGGMVTYDSFSVETEFVMLYNSTTAISMGNEVVISGGNRELKGQMVRRRFTHVWTKVRGEWALLARHANNVCEK